MENKKLGKKGITMTTLVMIIIFAAILLLFIFFYSGAYEWLSKTVAYPGP